MKLTWCEITMKYLHIISMNKNIDIITRKELCEFLPNIKKEIQYLGKTPDQTLSRTLQILRDMGYIDFIERGRYQILDFNFEYVPKLSKGEQIICKILDEMCIEFEREKKFDTLQYNSYLRLDFYFVKHHKKFAIEYDGLQHRQPVEYFGGKKSFEKTQQRDRLKNEWCKKNNVKLLRCERCEYKHLKFEITKFILENQIKMV